MKNRLRRRRPTFNSMVKQLPDPSDYPGPEDFLAALIAHSDQFEAYAQAESLRYDKSLRWTTAFAAFGAVVNSYIGFWFVGSVGHWWSWFGLFNVAIAGLGLGFHDGILTDWWARRNYYTGEKTHE